MTTGSDLAWWGYIHQNGSVQVKRWWGDQRDIEEAKESDFVETTYGPFMAANRQAAIDRVKELHGSAVGWHPINEHGEPI